MKRSNNRKATTLATALFAAGNLAMATAMAQAGPGTKIHGQGNDTHMAAQSGHMGHNMPGDPKNISRTVVIIAKDTEFNLKKIQVRDGETIRFIVKNKGELVHEMSIGTPEMQKQHQAEMMKMMDAGHLQADKVVGKMDHGHGNSALVEPGKEAEILWMFHKGAMLEFGCNVPGHYEQGMKGIIDVM